jgi:hypothetical protein
MAGWPLEEQGDDKKWQGHGPIRRVPQKYRPLQAVSVGRVSLINIHKLSMRSGKQSSLELKIQM